MVIVFTEWVLGWVELWAARRSCCWGGAFWWWDGDGTYALLNVFRHFHIFFSFEQLATPLQLMVKWSEIWIDGSRPLSAIIGLLVDLAGVKSISILKVKLYINWSVYVLTITFDYDRNSRYKQLKLIFNFSRLSFRNEMRSSTTAQNKVDASLHKRESAEVASDQQAFLINCTWRCFGSFWEETLI